MEVCPSLIDKYIYTMQGRFLYIKNSQTMKDVTRPKVKNPP